MVDMRWGHDLAFCLNVPLGDPTVCLPPPPSNDTCGEASEAYAQPLVGTNGGSNVCSSVDDSAPSCGGSADVWWYYTPTQSCQVTIDTCGSSFDTILAVYDGCAGQELACNDDCVLGLCGGLNSCVSLDVTAGQTIWIQVLGYGGSRGEINLQIIPPLAAKGSSGTMR
jgi:hypothetical protein